MAKFSCITKDKMGLNLYLWKEVIVRWFGYHKHLEDCEVETLARKYFCCVGNDQIRICISKSTHGNAVDFCFRKQMHLHHTNVGLIF